MRGEASIASRIKEKALGKRFSMAVAWLALVILFATQWYAYDAVRAQAYAYDAGRTQPEPFSYYLWWSGYIWAVLTPLVLWFAYRHPIERTNWQRILPQHVAASLVLTFLGIALEATLGWLRRRHDLSLLDALRHYFSQHLQTSLLTYWILVAAVHIYRMHDQARRRELHATQLEVQLAAAQLEVLRAQLQPHFLFNTLQAATILIHEDPTGAEDVLLRLSRLLRISLDDLHVQQIPVGREIEFLECYLGIQQRRFGDRLRVDLRVDPDVVGCAVPALVLQPLVENAIRHGIGKHKEDDVVSIRVFPEQGRLHLEVRNLTGKLDDTGERLLSRGMGLANTRLRLERLYGTQQSLQLYNLDSGGVGVALSIPLRRLLKQELQVSTEAVL